MMVHNVQNVSDISLRNIYQKESPETQNMTMSNPWVTSLRIRNIYNRFRQAPTELIKLLKPVVLSIALRNLYNKLNPQRESFSINLPTITFIEVRPLLQKLRTWGLDETFKITLPNIIEIYKKDVVTLYVNPDILEIKIDTPEPLELEVKNILNKSTQRGPDLEVSLPEGIELGGSVKPVLTFPILDGEITEDDIIFGINLTWNDSSITHTGYTLYKGLAPIPVNTTQEPYIQLGRDVKQFDDPSVDEDTTYYYRVTPKTIYGNLFSNQVMFVVPLSLRAPSNVTSIFSSLSETYNVSVVTETMGKPVLTMRSYDSLSKPKYTNFTYEPSLDFTYVTFEATRLHQAVVTDKSYDGLSTLLELSADFTTQQSIRNFISNFNGLSTVRSAKHSFTSNERPVYMQHSFAGLTVVDANDPYVRLDSAILDPKQEYESHSSLGDVTHGYQGFTSTGDLVGEYSTLINVDDIQSFVDTQESVFGLHTNFKSLDNATDAIQTYAGLTDVTDVNQSLVKISIVDGSSTFDSLTGTNKIKYTMNDVPMLDDLSQEYTSLDSTERVSSYAMTLEGVHTYTSSCSTAESCKIVDNSYTSLDSSLVMEPVYSSYSKPMSLLSGLTTLENVDNIHIHNSSEMVLDMYYKGFSSLEKSVVEANKYASMDTVGVTPEGYWVYPEEPKLGSVLSNPFIADSQYLIYVGRSGGELVYLDTRNDPASKSPIIRYNNLQESMWSYIQQPDGSVQQDANNLKTFGPSIVPAVFAAKSKERIVLPFFDDLMIAYVFRDHRYEPWATAFYDLFYNTDPVFSSASIEGTREEGLKTQIHCPYYGVYADAGNYQEDPAEHTSPLMGLLLPEPEPYYVKGGVQYTTQEAVKILNATMPWEPPGLP